MVVDKGLAPNERVVTNGILRLRDNSRVSVQPQPTAPTETTTTQGSKP